jgi:hypothetical protein
VVDPAGAQHGQRKAVLDSHEYDRDYLSRVLARRPYGNHEFHPENYIGERHLDHQYFLTIAFVLNQILEYVADQLAEWQHEHVGVENMMKSSVGEYQRLKPMLLTHLATTARESVIFSNGEPGSASDHINVRDRAVNVSERQRQRFQRKRLRKWANMEPSERAEFENNPNMGWF